MTVSSRILPVMMLSAFLAMPAMAQEGTPVSADSVLGVTADQGDMAERKSLAARMMKINNPREIVAAAAAAVAMRFPADQHETVINRLISNYDFIGLEDAMIGIMAESFTQAELQKMVEYNESAEARSARAKMESYQEKVQPEVTRRLDAALLKARTGGDSDVKAAPEKAPEKVDVPAPENTP